LTASIATTLTNQINPLGLCTPINKNAKHVSSIRAIRAVGKAVAPAKKSPDEAL